jgi:hypothetical protein
MEGRRVPFRADRLMLLADIPDEWLIEILDRHTRGDWGIVGEVQSRRNDALIRTYASHARTGAVISRYSQSGRRAICIVTHLPGSRTEVREARSLRKALRRGRP